MGLQYHKHTLEESAEDRQLRKPLGNVLEDRQYHKHKLEESAEDRQLRQPLGNMLEDRQYHKHTLEESAEDRQLRKPLGNMLEDRQYHKHQLDQSTEDRQLRKPLGNTLEDRQYHKHTLEQSAEDIETKLMLFIQKIRKLERSLKKPESPRDPKNGAKSSAPRRTHRDSEMKLPLCFSKFECEHMIVAAGVGFSLACL